LKYFILFLVAGIYSLVSGCASISYYAQAAQGQFSLINQAKPIHDWLSDPAADEKLKEKLKRVQEIRQFASRELGLPNNASYTSYADLKRQFVVWNVVATPELSLVPLKWCFPVAGCVDYRGYYDKQAAQNFADALIKQGMDVRISGVPAYSTLGYFNDPVLSTFIHYSEPELARLIFHELAHQIAYASGDSTFNESFATTIEEIGVTRWLADRGDENLIANYRLYQSRRKDFLNLLNTYRFKFEEIYRLTISDEQKRKRKIELIRSIESDYTFLKQTWGGYTGYDRWFNEPVSNAHFVLIATYHELVPEFKALLAEKGNLKDFYREVSNLAGMSATARHQVLQRYTPLVQQTTIKSELINAAASQ